MSTDRASSQRYREDGFYLSHNPIIHSDVIERACEGMDKIRVWDYDTGEPPQPSRWNPGDSEDELCKIEMPQKASHGVRELVSQKALGEFVATVTGACMVQVWWVQLLCKPSSPIDQVEGVNVGWHQDRQYWGVWEEGSELFTAWVAVSDVTSQCGPMRFVRGSHRWGFLDEGNFSGQDLSRQRNEDISLPAGESWEEVEVVLPAGGASVHDRLVYHGSGPNHSGALRRSFAIHMRSDKSRPIEDKRQGLTEFLDNSDYCPVIYGRS